MATPIVEQIAQAIVTRFQGISKSAGYEYTASSVVRPTKFGGFSPENFLIVLEQDDPEEDEGAYASIAWRQPFMAHLFVRVSDDDTVAIDTVVNTFVADVHKAIMSDPTWSGKAHSTYLRPPVGWVMDDGAFEGATVRFEVLYSHSQTSPYT